MKDTKIITVANQKGGCGKTTITMQLAGALSLDNLNILVVDADPQGTSTRWASSADDSVPFLAHIAGLRALLHSRARICIDKTVGDSLYYLLSCFISTPLYLDNQYKISSSSIYSELFFKYMIRVSLLIGFLRLSLSCMCDVLNINS